LRVNEIMPQDMVWGTDDRNRSWLRRNERGWSSAGIPKVDTLKQIGLWNFLNEETKTKIAKMNGQ
jgi:hypothetical protein